MFIPFPTSEKDSNSQSSLLHHETKSTKLKLTKRESFLALFFADCIGCLGVRFQNI